MAIYIVKGVTLLRDTKRLGPQSWSCDVIPKIFRKKMDTIKYNPEKVCLIHKGKIYTYVSQNPHTHYADYGLAKSQNWNQLKNAVDIYKIFDSDLI